jgi:acyl carrier protein
MNHISESELIDVVIQWLHENAHTNGSAKVEITPDIDLIASGVLTSLGIIELLVFIEGHTNRRIDLTDVEPSEFSVVKSLCRAALGNQDGMYKHADSR